ncbi:hypothetical protein SAMN04515671_2598 [Nakamurella panacisegetis]|uniref:LPXTG-motif cell wall anchor domain-containing protein n=1 Tax=Nakamurella panacisegetis TaxID=1090615 RepID=A0A1H0P3E4_9ACTN|nr:hypothetical protein [Nakamurella panacisegetis]SDO99359.1 hypothetical protein SAMN04515671_2598 [Nakamurella panacisegetis]
MRRNLLIGLGGLILVLGLLFLLQGSGVVHGSPMTDDHFWIYAGAVIAVVGAALLSVGLRVGRR